MIDVKFILSSAENLAAAKASQVARGEDPAILDEIVALDQARKDKQSAFDNVRAAQKAGGKLVAAAKTPEAKQAALAEVQHLAAEVKSAQAELDAAQSQLDEKLWQIANFVESGVPSGGEDDFVVIKEAGHNGVTVRDLQAEGITPEDHTDIGERLGIFDTARGAKVSGSRFYFLTGIGARLELALLNLAVDLATERGFKLMITPTLVRPEIMAGTGFLGKHGDEIYRLREPDEAYLVGTSEVALAGYHSDEIVDLSNGPIKLAGWSACYRREAGSYGKDVRGIIRVHQFHKVEMFVYAKPEEASTIHQELLALEEEMLSKVELPFRVIDTAAGDLGSSAARKFDCEAWLPSQNRFLELTSTSNCTTFQARRLNTRFKTESGTEVCATLNGTLATTRWIVAILENHLQADGSVRIPKALQPYLGGLQTIQPPTQEK